MPNVHTAGLRPRHCSWCLQFVQSCIFWEQLCSDY